MKKYLDDPKGEIMKRVLMLLGMMFLAAPAWAGVCTAVIQRVCQPEKSCRISESRTQLASSPEECLEKTKSFCTIYFTEGVAAKKIQVGYEGQSLKEGQDICQ